MILMLINAVTYSILVLLHCYISCRCKGSAFSMNKQYLGS